MNDKVSSFCWFFKGEEKLSSEYIRKLRSKIGNDLILLPSVAAVILDSDNRLLLQEKEDGAWSLPAGMIEPGESPEGAVVREVKEETGLVIKPQKILDVFAGKSFRYQYSNGDWVEYTVVLYKCLVVADTGIIQDSETKSTCYFDKQSMPRLALPYPLETLFDED